MDHTHEDVDAGFSNISRKLRTNDCESLDELETILPSSNHFTHMFDVKAWLDVHLVDIQKQTQPLHSTFTKNEEKFKPGMLVLRTSPGGYADKYIQTRQMKTQSSKGKSQNVPRNL